MRRSSARYLLRVDDLCPTVRRDRWRELAGVIYKSRLRPILAVVPDNLDPALCIDKPDGSFWQQMLAMEQEGAAIALHGYQHRALSRGRSLVPLHRRSEFAGVPLSTQRSWIRSGLEILRSRGLSPTIWVAPRHGFDRNTLKALREERITLVSDGFARRPFVRGGLTWIPQQLWGPVEKRSGLWTICLHTNTITSEQLEEFAEFVSAHVSQFVSVEQAIAQFPALPLTVFEEIRENAGYARRAIARIRRGMMRRLCLERDSEGPLHANPKLGGRQIALTKADRDTKLHADQAQSRG